MAASFRVVGDPGDAHNALGQVLRDQRIELIRQELLLDTMVQNTPNAAPA